MRILLLTPYPIRVPRFGGQIRAAAIASAYRDAGHEVAVVGFYDPLRVPQDEIDGRDVPLSPQVASAAHAIGPESEMSLWRAVAQEPAAFAAFAASAREVRPDILQFEEPYLWFLAHRLHGEACPRARLIHSSHNFETEAKRDLAASGAAITGSTLADVARLERKIAAEADLVVVVAEHDARAFRRLGARRVCVAPNGVAPFAADARAIAALRGYVGAQPFALFVSSAHPPNAAGLLETVVEAAGKAVLRSGLLLVCGDVCRLIRQAPEWRLHQHVFARTRLLGRVDDGVLAALFAAAHVVVLPKTKGGGSNLKTAEALASGRPIAATRRAFQGFEPYVEAPGVSIAEDGGALWRHVEAALASPRAETAERELASLYWGACLEPMIRGAEALAPVSAPIEA